MIDLFKVLALLISINMNQETVLLVMKELWQRVQDGLTLSDIENIVFFILFIRFIILALRYNIKTSFYITCIGLFAGYLWYRHLIDLISVYLDYIIEIPYLERLGVNGVELESMAELLVESNLDLGNKVHWYNPGELIYYAFTNGIVKLNQENSLTYYIDPISMIVSNLSDSIKLVVLPVYYVIYNQAIPAFLEIVSDYWTQISGLATYSFVTRIGKRYCPYLIRWHWTFLLVIAAVERILLYFVDRVSYFQENILIPQVESLEKNLEYVDQNIILQINLLNGLIVLIVCFHFGLIFLGLFHAICGQYFYVPFIVDNVELHVGPRPKKSIYSGGNTPWQDEKQKNAKRFSPTFGYGFFRSRRNSNWNILKPLIKLVAKILKKLRDLF